MTTEGYLMAKELAQAQAVFCQTARQKITHSLVANGVDEVDAFYTVARGSSDAAANILSYEFMRETQLPMTSMPPSLFSLGGSASLTNVVVIIISQSGQSHDLIYCAKGAKAQGAKVVAITNNPASPIGQIADLVVPIDAGPELAVPATKSVVGSVAAGMALLSAYQPKYAQRAATTVAALSAMSTHYAKHRELCAAILRTQHMYIIGRDTGYGAAQEVALKLKECCSIHAEAYSASEVLHGPFQLAIKPLLVIILDTGEEAIQDSLNQAENRFRDVDSEVFRISTNDFGGKDITPAAAAALLLMAMYPIVLQTALALGFNPDAPETLSKVTQTT